MVVSPEPGRALVARADARALPFPGESIDLIVTSPPYFMLRTYSENGQPVVGQIGNELTVRDYIAALVVCTREWMRVLKPTGSLVVNLGDKYSNRDQGAYAGSSDGLLSRRAAPRRPRPADAPPEKSLMNLPARYVLACTDELGLIHRARIIWAKQGMPESVTDRVRTAHEECLHLTRQRRYYADVSALRQDGGNRARERGGHPDGALPGSVWHINTRALRIPPHVAHARCCGGGPAAGCESGLVHEAPFPVELARRFIVGWCPPGGVVLDPFGGSGTVALAATALGRVGVSLDLSAGSCAIAQWRVGDPYERAAVTGLDLPRPPVPSVTEPTLF